MSSVYYQFVSTAQTSWCFSRTCEICKKTVERQGRPPHSESEGGTTQRFGAGAFHGWVNISFRLEPTDGSDPREIYLDVCAECRPVLFDYWVMRGLDWSGGGSKTIYLDADGKVVEDPTELQGRPMCVWRAEGKIGIRPCRRFRGHDGECSVDGDGAECPACPEGNSQDENTPPTIYSQRALEHHAQTEHYITKSDDGWWIGRLGDRGWWSGRRGVAGNPYASALAALEALVGS